MLFGFPKSSFGEHTFVPKFQPEFVVDSFDELSEMEIRSKKEASCRRLPQTKIFENRKTFRTVVLSTFSSHRSPNLVLKPLKKCSKRRFEMFSGFRKSSFREHTLCKMIQTIVSCDVLVFWDDTIFCKNFAR